MNTEKNWTNFINWFAIKPKLTGFLLSLVLSICVIAVYLLRIHIQKENERNEMKVILADSYQKIEKTLKNCYATSVSLALTLDSEGVPQNFDTISKALLKSNPAVSLVELVPHGVIKYIYPLKGNEEALNLNVFGTEYLKIEAEKSITSNKIYFAGPLKLRQGGIGIVGRLPIYNNNKFWGFTAVIIKLETLLKVSGVSTTAKSNYYFQLSKKNPITLKEEFFLPKKTDISKSNYVSESIADSDCVLYLVSKKSYSFYPLIILSTFFGLVVCILFGILTTILLRRPEQLRILLKEQEVQLLKNEMRFKAIFDQATIGFAIINTHNHSILEVNKKFSDMLGYTQEEIKTGGVINLTHLDDIEDCLNGLNKLDEGEIIEYTADKRYITKSGKIIWINLTISPLWEGEEKRTTYIAFITEITKRIEDKKNLRNTLQLVTEQNKRLLNFSYIVSHNLRSHTSNIDSIISLIDSAESEGERLELMQLLKSVSYSLDETMKHLNEVVNINSNNDLVVKQLNLNKYILKTKNILADQIASNEVTFITNITNETIINYNKAYLESIIYNLISNAIRYRHPDRKPVITLNLYPENDSNVIEVSDNGIGIDLEKNADKIFGMYRTFSTNPDARGIGLFITKNQVDAMGGIITVTSTINVGTTFKIYTK